MKLDILFTIHAIITLAAAFVLFLSPALIPQTVNIHLDKSAYLLSYLLGAAELSFAVLSFGSRTLSDAKSIRLVCRTFIIFHMATATGEALALLQGAYWELLVNIALRIVIAFLFYFYGWRKVNETTI